jgi:uncharacterized protein YjiS (DUF1127 family)
MKIGYLSALVSLPTDTTITPASRNPRDCSVRMSLARRFWSTFRLYSARRATASMLHALDDRTLADIGLTRAAIASAVFAKVRS